MFPKRSGIMLVMVLVAGCGDEAARQGDPGASAQESRYVEKVTDDLDSLADAEKGVCRNTRQIRRAVARLEADADHLPSNATDLSQGVDKVVRDARKLLRICRQTRKLERATDELNKAADEVDQRGEEP